MGFGDLSTECVDLIASHLGPVDLVNFALTSKFSCISSARCLRRRSELHQRFASLCVGQYEDIRCYKFKSRFEHSDEVLYEIWKDPAVSDYIEHVYFDLKSLEEILDPEEIVQIVEKVIKAKAFQDLRAASPSVPNPFLSEETTPADVLETRQAYSTARLLAQLPNIRKFDIAISRLTTKGLDQLLVGNDSPCGLGRIEEVGYVATQDLEEVPFNFPLHYFVNSPRLSKLRICTHNSFLSLPGLSRIEITGGDIITISQTLPECLKQFTKLKSFRYHMNCGCGGGSAQWQPDFSGDESGAVFFKGLQDAVGASLEELSLTGFYWPADRDLHCASASRMQTRTFTGFPKLKFLEVELQSLLDYEEHGDGGRSIEDEPLDKGFHRHESDSQDGEKLCTTAIVDILPPSIENLRLGLARRPKDELHPAGLFKGFGQQAPTRLPNLKAFAYCHNYWRDNDARNYMRSIKAELKEAGVRIARISDTWEGLLKPEHHWAPRIDDMCFW